MSCWAQGTDVRFSLPAYSGFGDRLLSEVKKLAPKDVKIRVGVCRGWANWAAKGLEHRVVQPPLLLCPRFPGTVRWLPASTVPLRPARAGGPILMMGLHQTGQF